MNLPLIGDGIHAMWDLRLVLDMFIGGMGAAAVLLAVIVSVAFGWSHGESLRRAAYIAGAICVALGTLLVISELTHPERIARIFLSGRYTSPVVWGAFAQVAAIVLCVLGIFYRRSVLVGSLAAAACVVVVTYHGSFLAAMGGRPAWPLAVVALFWISAMACGAAYLAIVSALSSPEGEEENKAHARRTVVAEWTAGLLGILSVGLIANGIYAMSQLPAPGHEVDELLASLLTGGLMLPLLFGVVVTGVIGILAVVAGRLMRRARKAGRAAPVMLPLGGALLVLSSGFFVRYVVLAAGQTVPLLPL